MHFLITLLHVKVTFFERAKKVLAPIGFILLRFASGEIMNIKKVSYIHAVLGLFILCKLMGSEI